MADEIVTRQQLVDAGLDAESLQTFISGSDIEDVLTRLGQQYPTLAKLIRILMETGGWKAYQTEAALLATVPTVNPSVGYAFDTKKMYLWNGTSWINEGLSQVDQANLNTDSKLIALLLPALIGKYQDYANKKYAGYINKTNGVFVPNNSWYATDFIATTDTAKIFRDGVIIGNSSSACSVAFYDANFNFLGYYVDSAALFSIKAIDVYATAKYVRLSYQATSNTKIYVFEPDILKFVDDYLTPYIGKPTNVAGTMTVGYVLKTDGTLVSLAGWGVTDYIAVDATSLVTRDADPVATSSVVAPVACYDANKNYLGYVQNIDRAEKLKIGRKYPAVKFIRACFITGTTYNLYVQTQAPTNINDQIKALDIFNSDFFTATDTSVGFVTITGGFNPLSSWTTTPLTPCKMGQKFSFTGYGSASTASSISLWDKDGKFLESIYAVTGSSSTTITIANSNARYIRASAANAYPKNLTGIELPKSTSKQYSTIVPSAVYALKNEPIYLYADGIVGNAENVAWNISGSNRRVCKVVPTTSDSIPIKLQTTEDLNNKKVLAEFNVLVTDTPVNPSAKRYIIALGDSLTDGTANSSVQGAWVNECSRRLNGVGYQLLPNELSPAPLSLSNIEFIGTRGDNVVKHEGRGGWAASHYLNSASVNGVTNAFWNPDTSQFDLSYYLNQNGFNAVNSTGSNLTVIILLGWNDVYKTTSSPAASASDLSTLIDKLKSTHPDIDIICLGLNQAPDLMFKTFEGTRYVSKREVFESIKAFNDAYKAVIATKTKVDFLQISCTFCSEIGYNTTITDPNTDPTERDPTWHRLSARSVTQLEAVDDHVHPNKVGYAMIGDTVCYFILYKYCRA
ncbi:SGNH/GDSL hydrolase family protein [Acinetobacter calcoaceticus]